jgi:spermidine synthase
MALILCTIFFISGASALVFETLWFHQAGIAFGNSVWASSLVLSGFMGGLALGSAIAVWRGDRIRSPVLTYAGLEIVIGVAGVSLALALPSLGTVLTPLLKPFFDVPLVLNILRLLFVFLLLLVPSTAMGLTLPLLAKALVLADSNFGRVLGRLYGWNTLGAVFGALLAELLFLETLGVRGSAFAAGAMNLTAAIFALKTARVFYNQVPTTEQRATTAFHWASGARWLCAAFLSGLTLLALEVVWFRFLLLYVDGSSVSFSAMLAVVLAGISLGGLSASIWLRTDTHAHRFSMAIAFTAGIACVATYGMFPTVVDHFDQRALSKIFEVLIVATPLMFPVAFLSGVFFTLAGSALRLSCSSAATATGILTLANTTGATVGAFVGGFLLLPVAGIEASLLVLTICYGAIAMFAFEKDIGRTRHFYAVVGVYLISVFFFPTGAMARRHLTTAAARWAVDQEWRVVDVREGISETSLYVERLMFGRRQYLRLVTNSVSMSSTRFNARRYMKLYVYLPVAIHDDPKSALLISYGVGSTAKAMTETSSFEEIDVVDISKDILEMNSIVFPDSSENPLYDPRVTAHIEDGRYFLQTTDKSFDLITGEPPPPQLADVVNLYTQEHFDLIYEHLNEGGIATYWLPLHSLSDRSAKAIIKAFLNVFADASLWHGWREDLMLVGSRPTRRAPVSTVWFENQWNEPSIAAEMKNIGLEVPEQLGSLFIGGPDFLAELTQTVQPLVDNFPKRIVADSVLGQGRNELFASLRDTDAARERFKSSEAIRRSWPDVMIERTLPYFDYHHTIDNLIDISGYPLDKDINGLHDILTETSLTAPALWFLGGSPDTQHLLPILSPDERVLPAWQFQVAAMLFAERRYPEAAAALVPLEEQPAFFAVARIFRIYALCMASEVEAGRSLAEQAYPRLAESVRESWWDFFEERFGIEPRLTVSSER